MRALWTLLVITLCAGLVVTSADAGRFKGKPTKGAYTCRGGGTGTSKC